MSYLRPDERVAEENIKKAKSLERGIKGIGTAALGAGTAFAGAKLSSKILPFLNDLIPAGLAVKGISKISPKIGDFLKNGMSQGLDVKEGLNFIKENIEKEESKPTEKAPDKRNIIEQYSPELFQFIKKYIDKGSEPLKAIAMARHGKFGKEIDKIEKDHKTPFSSIVESIFGSAQLPKQQQQNIPAEQQQLGRQGQQGNVSEALKAAVDRIMQM